jgi:hypothetical protein
MLLSPRAPERWPGVERPWVVATVHPRLYWPSRSGTASSYGEVSERLQPLTQSRFLAASLIDNPPLPVGRWWTVERDGNGRPFMWAGSGAELWLPPVPAGTLIGLELRPAPGPTPLGVEIDHPGESFELDGRARATRLWTRAANGSGSNPVIVRLRRAEAYPPGGGDDRRLTTQLLDVVVRPPGAAWSGSAATEGERRGLRLELEGGYGAEHFPELGRGVWVGPEAGFRVEVDEPGRLVLRLAAPRPTAALPIVVVDGAVVAGPLDLDHRPTTVEISVDEAAVERGVMEFTLVSEAFQPSSNGRGADSRELGVVLLDLAFQPENPTEGWWNPPAHR